MFAYVAVMLLRLDIYFINTVGKFNNIKFVKKKCLLALLQKINTKHFLQIKYY